MEPDSKCEEPQSEIPNTVEEINLNEENIAEDGVITMRIQNEQDNITTNTDEHVETSQRTETLSPVLDKATSRTSITNTNTYSDHQDTERASKRGSYYHELWSDSEDSRPTKRYKYDSEISNRDTSLISGRNETQYEQCGSTSNSPSENNEQMSAQRSKRRRKKCRKPCYRGYRKRRYCCPGKRRYKAKRCCSGKRYNRNKINLCNRNWVRISIHPFINFLRVFRRQFCKDTSPSEIARRGKREWKKMSCKAKRPYYEQAKRARIRGYRT